VVSDHGEEFYERVEQERRLRYDPDSDHGHTLYEELLRVPGIVRVPGLKPGVVEDPVQTVDLFATLLHAVDVANPLAGVPGADGQDLLPVLAGEARPKPVAFIADVILHGAPRSAIRRGPWKLVLSPRPLLPLELYDLDADPGETHDVAAAHPDIVEGLRALLRDAQRTRFELRRELLGPAGLRATSVEWSHIAKLRALGYLH
jgi:choline-sulfatase